MNTRIAIRMCMLLLAVALLPACKNNKSGLTTTTTTTNTEQPAAGIPVTPGNFARAETDMYFASSVAKNGLGKIGHERNIAIDSQMVIRINRDNLYSMGVFDLDAGPVTVTLPDPGNRFLSILVINEDHYDPIAEFGGGTYRVEKKKVGTRYAMVALRLFVDPSDPKDMEIAHALQDKVTVEQPGGPGKFEIPAWDKASQDHIRDSLLKIASTMNGFAGAFGTKNQVDPDRHLVATAAGWGGNPTSVAVYESETPAKNDGATNYTLHVPANVPVDGFWSVSVYNEKGYFEKNAYNAYSLNSVTAKKNKDGSVDIRFGGCDGKIPNCIPIMKGWNYTVCLYHPRADILEHTWRFPKAKEVR